MKTKVCVGLFSLTTVVFSLIEEDRPQIGVFHELMTSDQDFDQTITANIGHLNFFSRTCSLSVSL